MLSSQHQAGNVPREWGLCFGVWPWQVAILQRELVLSRSWGSREGLGGGRNSSACAGLVVLLSEPGLIMWTWHRWSEHVRKPQEMDLEL